SMTSDMTMTSNESDSVKGSPSGSHPSSARRPRLAQYSRAIGDMSMPTASKLKGGCESLARMPPAPQPMSRAVGVRASGFGFRASGLRFDHLHPRPETRTPRPEPIPLDQAQNDPVLPHPPPIRLLALGVEAVERIIHGGGPSAECGVRSAGCERRSRADAL